MGNYNSCFDYKLMEQAANNLDATYNNISLEGFSTNVSNAVYYLDAYDNTHDVMKTQLDNLLDYVSKIESIGEKFSNLCSGIKGGIEAYNDAEGNIFLFLNKFANVIEKDLGNEKVASYIRDKKVTQNTMATSSSEFQSGATEEVTKFISDYAKYLDDNCPSAYASSEEWKEALEAKYEALGYSSYDASDLAYAEMAKWRTAQTGAEVTTNAISEFAEETYTDMEETVKTEYNELVDKYKNLGATEEQSKELATAESEYIDASEVAKESPDNWAYSESSKKYSEWQKLKEEYGITEESSNNSGATNDQNNGSGAENTTTDSGNGGGTPSDNDIQHRKTSTGTDNSSSDTNSSSQNDNSSSPSENNSSSQNQNTPSNGTEEKPSNGNEDSVISEGEEKVPETPSDEKPSDEKPSTTPEPDDSSSNNNNNNNNNNNSNSGDSNNNQGNTESNNNNNNTNNSGTINNNNNNNNNNTSNGGNSNYYPPSNNGNSGGSSSGGNYTGGGNSNAPSTGAGTPNDNVSTTTPSAPESDAGISDNTGETLDVISIDKDGGKSSVSTSSNDGGSVVPTILGVGVAGAAAVAGAKILHDKKKKDNEYSYEEDEAENDNSLANLDTYSGDDTTDTAVTMSPGKYRAGSANNLVLEDAPSDIRIDESIADIPNQKEELE